MKQYHHSMPVVSLYVWQTHDTHGIGRGWNEKSHTNFRKSNPSSMYANKQGLCWLITYYFIVSMWILLSRNNHGSRHICFKKFPCHRFANVGRLYFGTQSNVFANKNELGRFRGPQNWSCITTLWCGLKGTNIMDTSSLLLWNITSTAKYMPLKIYMVLLCVVLCWIHHWGMMLFILPMFHGLYHWHWANCIIVPVLLKWLRRMWE